MLVSTVKLGAVCCCKKVDKPSCFFVITGGFSGPAGSEERVSALPHVNTSN
jgi:hypothetical protein